jgi:hypothetical protein
VAPPQIRAATYESKAIDERGSPGGLGPPTLEP